MSGKPDDIPDDVWLEAGMKFDQLYDAEPDLEGGCEYGIKSMAAHMVMAERKRADDAVTSVLLRYGFSPDFGLGCAVRAAVQP